MKKYLILGVLIFSANLIAQGIQKNELIKTEWNTDYNEYYSDKDTITLYTLSNYTDDYNTLPKVHVIAYYNNAKDVVTIGFQKRGKAYLGRSTFNLCGIPEEVVDWTWKFDEPSQILSIYAGMKLRSSFKIIEREQDKQYWSYEIDKGKPTNFSADVSTLKMVRIQ